MRLSILGAALLPLVGLSAAAEDGPPIPKFTEETASAGVVSTYKGEWQYMVGGGVASFDCNGDRFADLLLAGGENPAKFFRNTSMAGGNLTFAEQVSGLEEDSVTGAYPLDMDSDGIMDLVLLRVGANIIMRGLGECRFAPANDLWGFEGGDGWSTALAAIWERGASWPTIAIGNYIDRTEEFSPWGSCTDNWLHRPGGTGFAPPLALKPSFCALSMLFTDWNRSGTPSLRISNDREYYEGGQEQMWQILPGQAPALLTEKDGWKKLKIWGMGIASADLDADGYPDYYLTSMADNKLQMLADPTSGKPVYKDVAFAKGATAHRPYIGDDLKPSTGWHAQFDDVNNDGLLDLFVAKGNVSAMPDFAMNDPNNLLLQNPDGTFAEAGDKSGIASMEQARGATLADFNMDGLLDLVVVNRNAPAQIWRNVSDAPGNWLGLALHQPGTNPDAIGAWIEVKAGERIMRREVTVGGGHVGGQTGWWHFGLAALPDAEVRVIWPDGTPGDWQKLAANGFYDLAPGQAATVWTAP